MDVHPHGTRVRETAPKLKLGSYRLGPVGRLYVFLGNPGPLLNALPVHVGEELAGTYVHSSEHDIVRT